MFQQIALSISTAIFFLCTVIVSSILPSTPAETDMSEEPVISASADVSGATLTSIVGKWIGGGRTFEFTDGGKLIYNGTEVSYSFDGEKLKVNANVGGHAREYTITVEVIDGRNIMIGGVTLHRTEN